MNTQIDQLVDQLEASPVNSNPFFVRFKKEKLTDEQLIRFAKQYFWFCQNFITALCGLIYNTPVDLEETKLELIKTLYSEMGYGKREGVHLNLLRKFTTALGISDEDLKAIKPIPEVKSFIEDLTELFANRDYRESIGGEFAIEVIAAPEFTYLYPGVQQYDQFTPEEIIFFKFHLAEEELHGDWLTEAVKQMVKNQEDFDLVTKGAKQAEALWASMWEGLYREVFQEEPIS